MNPLRNKGKGVELRCRETSCNTKSTSASARLRLALLARVSQIAGGAPAFCRWLWLNCGTSLTNISSADGPGSLTNTKLARLSIVRGGFEG